MSINQVIIGTALGANNFVHKTIPDICIPAPKGCNQFIDSLQSDEIGFSTYGDQITIYDKGGGFILNGRIEDKAIILFELSYMRPDFSNV